MKKMIVLFLLSFLVPAAKAEVCKFDFQKEPPKFDNDCVQCGGRQPQAPGKGVDSLLNPLLSAMLSPSDELAQIKNMEAFLSSKDNDKRCENINDLRKYFAQQFNKSKKSCEEGPSTLGRNKDLCTHILVGFNKAMMEMFENLLFVKNPDGTFKGFQPGMSVMKLDFAILTHSSWCNKNQHTWNKEKVFIDCGQISEWAKEVNQLSSMQASFENDRRRQNEASVDKDELKRKMFIEGCKAFDKPGTHNVFTSKLYLACATAQAK